MVGTRTFMPSSLQDAAVFGLILAVSVLFILVSPARADAIPPPLQQARDGVAPSEVVCSDERVQMTSPSGLPVCVFAESAKTLEQRGFALPSEDPHGMPFVEQPDAPEKPGAGSTGTDNPGERPFVTTWRTTSPDESITIPVGGATGTYTAEWGDGSVSANVTGDQTYTYADAGEYAVSISGNFTRILLGEDRGNAGKLVSIHQWGDMRWESMTSAFSGAALRDNAVDAPDLSMVTDMSRMFQWSSFNGNLTGWDVSSVEDMSWMFANSGFNGDVSGWDVSGVIDMSWMFRGTPFNGDVSGWDVSGVTDMSRMFSYTPFNGDISDWDVSGVEDMSWMFEKSGFNGDISDWDVSGVTDMSWMFYKAQSFNGNLSGWVMPGVEDMVGMFAYTGSFNGDVSGWDVSGVTGMWSMFNGAQSFNGNLSGWVMPGVEDMSRMFYNSTFNGDVSGWDVSGVTDMNQMFAYSDFNGDVSGWDVSGVENMFGMFNHADSFNSDISNWNVSGWTFNHEGLRHGPHGIHSSLLTGASSFAQNLGNWYIVLDSNTIDDSTGIVGMLSAQSIHLDIHRPEYGIGSGGDSGHFEIVDGNVLKVKDTADIQERLSYSVNVTSAGGFGTGNFRVLEVTAGG